MDGSIVVATDEPIVLIAENDRFDQLIMKRAFRAAQLGVAVHFVEHGEKLFDYLHECRTPDDTSSTLLPSIIFLDLNMPVLDGWKVLKRLRAEPVWKDMPIIVMSTIKEAHDINNVLALGANYYFIKPVQFNEMVSTIKSCAATWLGLGKSEVPQA